jgi:AcrR family transcriptional regulator
MDVAVNPDGDSGRRRRRQVTRTEQLIVRAATELFLADGYLPTTLAAVADAADVGLRTVYVRFGTKAALFKRVVDVAIVGDTDEVDVLGRAWMDDAFAAPTVEQRVVALASGGRAIMARTGPLFGVAQQAAAVEPLIAEQWQQGREQSRHVQRVVWTKMAADGLLPAHHDLDRIVDTASVLGAAETYLLITRMLDWDLDTYEAWLRDTLIRLAG